MVGADSCVYMPEIVTRSSFPICISDTGICVEVYTGAQYHFTGRWLANDRSLSLQIRNENFQTRLSRVIYSRCFSSLMM